ncbi:aromatic ring-hydroxylating dioxygenase subunit alpha [Phenylobacterium sp.]|uniref:aromatic ring-hydroxylating oxygenase subunit alpha n=1 Tax=Phenylobacterium sp. TaxID=1871053 RepID=UPI002DEB8503|nr:aromatic ring-hydroxylating dioxygenase subunit alpha [Phenylobacterium sp.]
MNAPFPASAGAEFVRDDYVPAADYISREFLELEKARLWPRAWQMACREEEIPKVGDYYTYDIADDSIVVVRTAPDQIRAYHNVCPHRGRRLTGGCGHTARFHCRFHGWQWDLAGNNTLVVDRDDWAGALSDEDVALTAVRVETWSGWVYVNMDPDCAPLADWLAPAKAMLDPFDLGGLRYQWRKSTILPCNWKVALEAFNEGYHVQTTHRQMLEYMDDVTVSHEHGRHAMFAYWKALPIGSGSRRIGGPLRDDIRPGILAYMEDMAATLNAGSSVRAVHAARRVMQEVPEGKTPVEVLTAFAGFIREDAERSGAGFPPITPQEIYAAGIDWHLFPNQIMLQSPTGLLGYRARPNGDDPDSCIWDVYSLQRYPPGEAPAVEQQWSQDHADEGFWGRILCQDYQNMGDIQRGMKSRGFAGSRPNPVQERAVSNFHRALHDFLAEA